jgi:hypothetical protein
MEINNSRPFTEHKERIEALRASLPHTVTFLELGDSNDSCYTYVLPYSVPDRFKWGNSPESPFYGKNWGSSSVRFMVEKGALAPLEAGQNPAGAVAVYFSGEDPVHVTKIRSSGRMVSKWGAACAWEHGVWEMPSNYGEQVSYFRYPNRQAVHLALFLHALESGYPAPQWEIEDYRELLNWAGCFEEAAALAERNRGRR